MQRYIEQLIGDLLNAKKFVPKETPLSENYEEFEQQMLAVENAPDMPVKKLYGVSYEEFPPSEKLTALQMQQIIDAVFDMWEAFNCSAEFLDGLPIELQYELVRDQFIDDVHYMPGWSMHYDFCCYWCPECKITEYCSSKDEIWTKEELELEQQKAKQQNKKGNL